MGRERDKGQPVCTAAVSLISENRESPWGCTLIDESQKSQSEEERSALGRGI